MNIKECRKCKLIKSNSEFNSDNVISHCKSCISERGRNNNLKRYYGISKEEYNDLSTKQNNCCAICNKQETAIYASTKKTKLLSVDHCHKTGKIRGLLCSNCNHGIGKFKDDANLLLAALKYLQTV